MSINNTPPLSAHPRGRRWNLRFWVLVLVVGILAGIGIVHSRTGQLDDAFITYRYARSLAAGQGFSYNPPELIFGSTTPLYSLGLGAAGWASLPIPTTSLVINWLSLVALALIVGALARQAQVAPSLCVAAMIMTVLIPGSYMVLGMETLLYAALVYGALWRMESRRYAQAALLAGLATLCRYDGGLVVVLCAASELLRTRRWPWRTMLIASLVMVPWLIAAQLMFGSIIPNTAIVKVGLAEDGNKFLEALPSGLAEGLLDKQSALVLWGVLAVVLAIAAFGGWCLWRRRQGLHMLIWMALYISAYTALRVSYLAYWYYYMLMPGLIVLLGSGVGGILQRIPTRHTQRRVRLTALALVAVVLAPLLLATVTFWRSVQISPLLGGRYASYSAAAEWVCANSDPSATVSVPEIGIVGWVCPRYIIDPYGLVTSEMVPYVRRNERLAGVASLRPDFIMTQHETSLLQVQNFPYAEAFAEPYTLVKTFGDSAHLPIVAIYRKAGR